MKKSLNPQQTGRFASLEYKSLISEFRLPTMLSPHWQGYLQKEVYKDKNQKPVRFSQLQPSSSPCLVTNPWVRQRDKQTKVVTTMGHPARTMTQRNMC